MNFLRKYWLKWNVRQAATGDVSAMNRLYLVGDPWKLDTTTEHFRFRETVRIIREKIADHFGNILEIGSGEGLQTSYLAPLADRVVGLDPSAQAAMRANARKIPNASFVVSDFNRFVNRSNEPFDLVTACEVLYYMPDIGQAYEKLNNLGRNCLITYYQGEFERLDKYFADKNVHSEI